MSEVIEIRGTRHVVWECKDCGVVATCPECVYERHRQAGGYHHCPNGHQWGWSKETSEHEKIRRERDRLKQDAARLEEEASQSRIRAEKAEAATKRLKKRASAGTCPCCQRTFANMAQHMKHQHPEFVAEGGAKVVPMRPGRASA